MQSIQSLHIETPKSESACVRTVSGVGPGRWPVKVIGHTGIDDHRVNLAHLLAGLFDDLIDDLALLAGTSIDVDRYTVLFRNGLDGRGSVLGGVRDNDRCARWIYPSVSFYLSCVVFLFVLADAKTLRGL